MVCLLVSIPLAIITAVLTVKKGALTLYGALEAIVLIVFSGWMGGWFGLSYLLIAYFSIAIIDKCFKRKTDSIFCDINKKSGARDHIQVAANGAAGLLWILLYGITHKYGFLLGYAVAIAQALSDSVASDVGVLSKSEPVSICRFRRVERGMSGGVSLLGTVSGLAAGAFCGAIYFCFFRDWKGAALVVLFSFLGNLIDSVLGDLFQEKFRCSCCGKLTEKTVHCGADAKRVSGVIGLDNCMVNLISNFLASALVVVCTIW